MRNIYTIGILLLLGGCAEGEVDNGIEVPGSIFNTGSGGSLGNGNGQGGATAGTGGSAAGSGGTRAGTGGAGTGGTIGGTGGTGTGGVTSGTGGGSNAATQWVSEHNRIRIGATPAPSPALPMLTWSAEIAATAQAWADKCVYQHDYNSQYGENIAANAGSAYSPAQVVNAWASEVANYTYASNSCAQNKVCGHYTQLVWRATTQVGCGYKKCTNAGPFGSNFQSWELWVCRYNPPGNYIGQKPY